MHEHDPTSCPSEGFAAHWRSVLEVPLDAAETFRLLMEGSRKTSTKEFTDEAGFSRATQVESRVTLLHAVGRPVGTVHEWLRLPELQYATVTIRKLESESSSTLDKGIADSTTIPVRVGTETGHPSLYPSDDGYQIGPFTVSGAAIEEPAGVVLSVEVFLRRLSLPSSLVLEVVDLEPYMRGRRQLLDTWGDA